MDELTGKKLLILGLARQGKALARFAAQVGARVVVSDLRSPERLQTELAELAAYDIEFVLGEHPMTLLEETDVVAVSGGVPLDTPFMQKVWELGVAVTNDSQEFIRRAPSDVVGITGSAGKTTTTSLVGVMGQVAGRRTWVGGNIGRPLLDDLHKMHPDDMVVQELSSFQLELWQRSPKVAVVLNITPNHLDRHKTMDNYIAAKANILRHQQTGDVAILCADDENALSLKDMAMGRVRLFSTERGVADGAYVRDGYVWVRDGIGVNETAVLPLSEIPLPGQHNLSNILAAVTVGHTVGISPPAMRKAIRTFKGVEHRLERVRVLNGVTYVNDSIATAPERAMAALRALKQPIVLLAGGRDKDMVWDGWVQAVCQRTERVILFGELADLMEAKLKEAGYMGLTRVNTLAEAVEKGYETAVGGDIVLLSPGGTSFDAYRDFAQRGEHFRQLVQELGE